MLMRKYSVSRSTITRIASVIETVNTMPPRKKGGPNYALPSAVANAIRDIFSRAKAGGSLNLVDVSMEVGKKTGLVPSPAAVRRALLSLPLQEKHISINYSGRNIAVDDLIHDLGKKGINAKRIFRKPLAHSRKGFFDLIARERWQ